LFFPLALPFKVCESNVLVAVLPVHSVPSFVHLLYEVLSASGCLSAVHNRQCYILNIALYLAFLGLLQEVVCLFIPRNSFFSFFSGECLAFLRNMKPLLPALLIAPVFQVLQIRFAPLQLVTILIIHAVHYKMAVNVSSVYMSGNKHFMPFPCFRTLGKLHRILMGLLWCDMLVLMVGLYEVLVGSSPSLAPQLLSGCHFVLNCIWFTVQTADKFIFRLFLFRHIVQCLPYACF
jgi:hypothetical protein